MAGIAAVQWRMGTPAQPEAARPVFERLRADEAENLARWSDQTAALAVARPAWQCATHLGGPAAIAARGAVAVAADAALFHRDELRARLATANVAAADDSPAELVLAAWLAWGEACVDRLEGDYAFIVRDGRTGGLFAARDPVGGRPLFFAEAGAAVVIASRTEAVLGWKAVGRGLNLALLAETLAGRFGAADETVHAGVAQLPAGECLAFGATATGRRRFFRPPEPTPFRGACAEEGARELRERLVRAVAARLAPDAVTSVWMSGGRDSTAVYGAGKLALRRGAASASAAIRAVSMSYPPGDEGREDDPIARVAAHWDDLPHWVDARQVPSSPPPAVLAATRDDPFVHAFEGWNRSLARGSRAVGARIALTGFGGDRLFALSAFHVSDLLVRGHWMALGRAWREHRARGGRQFFRRLALRPALPPAAWALLGALRAGDRLQPLERPLPPWIDRRFVAGHGLEERRRLHRPTGRPGRWIEAETRHALHYAFFARIAAEVGRLARDEGVELRWPLLDRGVLELALGRPWWERASGGETKHLLRRAMGGLLPADVLAPRTRPTGTIRSSFDRGEMAAAPAMIRAALPDSRLVELGVVDAARLSEAADGWERGTERRWGYGLFATLHAEHWLRAQESSHRGRAGREPAGGCPETVQPQEAA